MRLLSKLSLLTVFLLFIGAVLSGCDESPTSAEDFKIQPGLELSASELIFVNGQTPSPTIELDYQGLDEAPSVASSLSDLEAAKIEEEGSPKDGQQTWKLEYKAELSGNFVDDTLSVTATGNGREFEKTVPVRVNNPISVVTNFEGTYAFAVGYETGFANGPENGAGEQFEVKESGGSTAQVESEQFAEKSNGKSSLAIDASAGDPITMVRRVSAPGSDVFSFLLKPDSQTDFTLTIGFTEETPSGLETRTVEVDVPSGTDWRKYNLAVGQLYTDFDPVAQRANGNGPLVEISMTTDKNVSYNVDELLMGTSEKARIEINDFQTTSFAYGAFSDIEFEETSNVATNSSGFTARTISYSDGDNFFGYNFDHLSPHVSGTDEVAIRLGQVSLGFNLYVFIETHGDVGGYAYDGGKEVAVSAGDSWQEITVPIGDLGQDPSVLASDGIRNVGFEIRRAGSSSQTISFAIDDIRIQAGN